ncbi:MAG: hypothetical protein KF843_15020 [Flavobacteriales bacterium]|nr:hypothetical protein [Flavobacteriales bacterium]
MEEHHLTVPRSARYHTLGDAAGANHIWIALHGYGQLARFFLRPFVGLESGKFIAAPEGLSRYYTDAEHSRVGATWMTREDRDHEIADQIGYLDRLVEHLRSLCPPGIPVSVLGFSQGVATACRWAMKGRTPFEQIVLWGGSLPPELAATELRRRWSDSTVLLVHGMQDKVVTAAALAGNEAKLRESGLGFRTVEFEGGHALDGLTLKRILDPGQ